MRSTLVILLLSVAACSRPADKPSAAQPDAPNTQIKMNGPLIDAKVTMVAAWEFPKNPTNDKTLDSSKLSEEIKRGFRLFTNTPGEAPDLVGGQMSCTNCHMNGGQRERSMPLVAVPGMFPEYNRRSARLFSLVDRVVDCFLPLRGKVRVVLFPLVRGLANDSGLPTRQVYVAGGAQRGQKRGYPLAGVSAPFLFAVDLRLQLKFFLLVDLVRAGMFRCSLRHIVPIVFP